ncbi:putative DNA uptake lipoprotein [Desulfamplus magnetovallimortis]|uniref:Putative DNA uptake lipoprotein n=1 Tax=Desulfamplus magnetovallimortis TaxID=1246637 RepID=A0A1W1HE59_9BACT|nr:outer membrane protein assembly factor BamD [Desulfamplus magnetovallimortis]SLM30750.1 putative DNA uptake lipoprotein [Desulfamplus magnetovallimortis]
MRIISIGLLLFIFASISGCAWFSKDSQEVEKTARELAAEGNQEFKEKNYKNAIEAFTTLRDWYPFSKYAILAELKIADSHFKLKSYEEAIVAYQEFESLHPRNEAVPYVIYRTGMCWYNRIESIDKDQTPAKKAMEQFQRLTKRFPDDKYSEKAQKKIMKCTEHLAGHEAYIAEFYLKAKKYKAALKRFETIFAIYPDTEAGKQSIEKIVLCRKLLEEESINE